MGTPVMTIYGAFHEHIAKGTIDLDSDTFKCALVTSSYTPVADTHTVWADASANEIAAGAGYSAGGLALTSVTVTRSGHTVTFDADDLVWTATGGIIPAFRYCVMYKAGTANAIVNPLVLYVLVDNTPADIPATQNTAKLTGVWNPSGVFTL